MSAARSTAVTAEATCIRCGCTDSRACQGGCSWELVDRRAQLGVCSSCVDANACLDLSAAIAEKLTVR